MRRVSNGSESKTAGIEDASLILLQPLYYQREKSSLAESGEKESVNSEEKAAKHANNFEELDRMRKQMKRNQAPPDN
eukprot:CAMPEP_0168609676 /NCGR_PEP_ID=MMETSP0449_2-20121227/1342_1 /TAXON_ID=1082188 /ORGANISM="Strombidium rassoulzadegani, Strain ras09" /LENGTH=76 /DNA_ID=CAMNT_0008649853 /DNA_START=88 /DNA_END=318 /DNA_ORIENTATION=-